MLCDHLHGSGELVEENLLGLHTVDLLQALAPIAIGTTAVGPLLGGSTASSTAEASDIAVFLSRNRGVNERK